MGTHAIRRGETLSSIAGRYNTTVSALVRANNIRNPNRVQAGTRLDIPGSRDSFQPARPSSRPHPQVAAADATAVRAPSARGGSALQRRLADEGRRVALSMNGYTSRGQCAKGVNRSIQRAMGFRNYGHANQIANNLPRNRFREVRMSLAEALRTPGLVLTWQRTSTRLGRIYGHTAITTGDGRSSVSDFVERNTLTTGGRSGLRVFMPIA